jgi:hypothetical protein
MVLELVPDYVIKNTLCIKKRSETKNDFVIYLCLRKIKNKKCSVVL